MSSASLFIHNASSQILRLGNQLIKPHNSVKVKSEIRLAQLSAGLALASVLLNLVGFITLYNLFGWDMKTASLLVNIILASLAYGFSKSRYHYIGGYLLVINPIINSLLVLAAGSDSPAFSLYSTVPVAFIYGSIFLSIKWLIGLTFLITATTFLFPVFIPGVDTNKIDTVGGQFLQWGVLFIIISASRTLIEREKLEEYQKVNQKLQDFQLELEDRVNQRTMELSIASELGVVLSQVRGIDLLLDKSVQIIRDRYKLYYAQIYIPDVQYKNLILRAGSGEVGRQLKLRGHRLPIDYSSLNGRAAFEKKPIILESTANSKDFMRNALLPLTQSEMCIPLLIGEKVVGILDIQSDKPNYLSFEKLPAFNALAGQLAIAIENASLFDQVAISNSELENEARRLTAEGWQKYLDAINEQENIEAVYAASINSLIIEQAELEENSQVLEIPIQITGTKIGSIEVEFSHDQIFSDGQRHLAQTVAEQVSRQLENLRLLNQAQLYQEEADSTIRRVTRQNWKEFLSDTRAGELGYMYDTNQVSVLKHADQFRESGLTLSENIRINNEELGELVVTGLETIDENTSELIRTVTEQLSVHLENLRLTEQSQRAFMETDALYTIISKLNSVKDYHAILEILSEHTILSKADQSLVMFIFDHPLGGERKPEWVIPISAKLPSNTQLAERYPLNAFEVKPNTLFTKTTVVIEDVDSDPRLDRLTHTLFVDVFNAASSIIIPLMVGDQSLGFILGNFSTTSRFNENEILRLSTVASQVAITVQGMRLLEQTIARARREQLLREVANQVNNASGTDSILKRAAEQVGKALKRPVYVYLGNHSELAVDNVGEEDVKNNGHHKTEH